MTFSPIYLRHISHACYLDTETSISCHQASAGSVLYLPATCSALVCALPSGNMLAEAMRRSGGVGAMGSQAQGYACLRRQQAPPCPKRVCSTAVACEASSIQPRCAGGAGPAGSRVATGGAVEGSPLWNDPKSEMPIRVVQTIR